MNEGLRNKNAFEFIALKETLCAMSVFVLDHNENISRALKGKMHLWLLVVTVSVVNCDY